MQKYMDSIRKEHNKICHNLFDSWNNKLLCCRDQGKWSTNEELENKALKINFLYKA